jgi:hypothetical protein
MKLLNFLAKECEGKIKENSTSKSAIILEELVFAQIVINFATHYSLIAADRYCHL